MVGKPGPARPATEKTSCTPRITSYNVCYTKLLRALARRFQLVKLDEPSPATAALILRGIRDSYEKAHRVVVRDDAIECAAEFSHRYITGRFLPDKAIDLLDTACARVKVSLSSKPGELEDKERASQAADREKRAIERDKANGAPVRNNFV